ncbi:hypothetical protein [Ancylomarina sp. 16SWW S1-10-2]|uniref:hypothetical protein n=1 Tax=Ancylomarina sp. 16SWW S1-10-2 TaxID=2499681 RepID=UPI0012ADF2BD|nr:hypothetical protein [Ancylomarina sp. 16SWW S1-10-2]MRT92861.1 hypothetical protein [Ancylomarina sp. 16SWW S1-10-2]
MYDTITKIFNNREISILFWVIIGITWLIINKGTRESIFDLVKHFVVRQILTMVNLMIIYIELIVILFIILNLWDYTFLKETIFWTFGVAFILLVSMSKSTNTQRSFKHIFYNNLKLIVILQFVSNLYVFNLVTELITIPILFFIGIVSGFSESRTEYQKVKKLFDIALMIYGTTVMVFSIYNVIIDFDNFAKIRNLKSFLLSPLFTLLYIPFVYLFLLYLKYESFYTRITHNLRDQKYLCRHIKWKIFLLCGFNLFLIQLVSKELKVLLIRDKTDFKHILHSIIKEGKHPIRQDLISKTNN